MHTVGLEYGEKTENHGKRETHKVGPPTWLETLRNVENEKCTLQDQGYGEKHSKTWKMRNAHCRTWSMEGKVKIMENENNKLQDVEYGEKH